MRVFVFSELQLAFTFKYCSASKQFPKKTITHTSIPTVVFPLPHAVHPRYLDMAEPRDSKSAGTDASSDPTQGNANESSQPKANATTSGDAKEGKTAESGKQLSLNDNMVESMLEMNPSLRNDLTGGEMDKKKAAEMLKKMDISELLTGLSVDNKNNRKDMGSFKFWQTQPVVRFDEQGNMVDGPIKQINPEEVPKEPDSLIDGFEWTTLDITNENELREMHELLNGNFVEDQNAMFRLNYSLDFLNWFVVSFSLS